MKKLLLKLSDREVKGEGQTVLDAYLALYQAGAFDIMKDFKVKATLSLESDKKRSEMGISPMQLRRLFNKIPNKMLVTIITDKLEYLLK